MLPNSTTFELGEATLTLRTNLRFSAQRGRHSKSYLIEDQSSGEFYRVGEGEYTFLSLLDGKTTLASALATTCSLVGASAFSEQDAASLCKWLVDSGLAVTRASTAAQRLSKRRDRVTRSKLMSLLNPISVRIPLFNPDRVVAATAKYLGWMFTPYAAVVWIFTCLLAIVSLAAGAGTGHAGNVEIFSRNNWFWLGLTWMALKVVHEYAHALTCRHFGGRVRHCGVLLLLLIPMPFVDVTSSWRFGNKYHRILVAAAGMLAEIFIAAIAALVWLRVDAGLTSQIAANIMFAASINTLLFNANPLMKFDGYHMLSDWLELPNLQKYGNQHVKGVCRRTFLGLNASPLPWAGTRGAIVKTYGFAALIWKLLICASLGFGAANLLPGIGFLIALAAITLWAVVPISQFVMYLIRGTEFEQPDRKRFGIVAASLVASLLLIGIFIPSPSVITAPIVVQYEPLAIIRSETSGFIETIHVQPDQHVRAGDRLITMKNPELQTKLIETQSRLEESRLAASAQQKQRNIGGWQIEQQNIIALQKQLTETQTDVDKLTILAPADGQVLLANAESKLGTFVTPGQELLSVGKPNHKEAIALIDQNDARHLTGAVNESVQLRIWGDSGPASGTVREVTPRVRTDVPHFAFAGLYGGPLTVANRSQYQDADDQPLASDTSQLVLLEPRIAMHIALDADTSERFRSGQTGQVYLRLRTGPIGPYFLQQTKTWLKSQIQTTHGI